MRKYIVVAVITAIVTSGVVVFGMQSNASLSNLAGNKNTAELSQDLASNPEFIASLQAKMDTSTTSNLKGDKGDKGDAGNAGTNGSSGSNGTDGDNGAAGGDGSDGSNGSDGTDGTNGSTGATGARGAVGATGLQGPKGDKGDTGAQGAAGQHGAAGAAGPAGATGAQGPAGLVSTSATGLTYDVNTQNLALTNGYTIPTTALAATWSTAYGWGNHANAGYVLQAGESGGQTVHGGTTANTQLTLQGNSAASGNTGTSTALQFKVGNNGSTTAMLIRNDGTISIGASDSYAKLTISGAIATVSNGDIFSQRDSTSNVTYPIIARYMDSGGTQYDGGTYIFGNGSNATVNIEKPAGNTLTRFRVRATTAAFSGNIAITTDGTNNIAPFQFVQITGLADNPTITSFNGTTYATADWNPAVVGMSSGGGCGTSWTNGALAGFKYWRENNNGNWRLSIDMSAPNDGCNSVQVMFVRKEFSTRANYGF